MTPDDWLCEGLPALWREARSGLPVIGLGVVRTDRDDRAVFSYIDGFGTSGYVLHPRDLPDGLRRASSGVHRLRADELEATAGGLVESRLLHVDFPEPLRREAAVRQVAIAPVPDRAHRAILVVGLRDDSEPAGLTPVLETMARAAADWLQRSESPALELDRLRRIAAADAVLPTLFRVLDVREIFDRLSAITHDALRHDFACIGLLNDDLTEMELYADSARGLTAPETWPMPFPPVQTRGWLYRVIDDLSADLLERQGGDRRQGGCTSLRVAIRVEDRTLGALKVTSRDPEPYRAIDLAVARHLADYVALALSHHRLSEETRRTEELRTRAVKMDLLDELLASITGAGELPEVFGRVSNVAQKVLAHDALVLNAVLPNGREARVYASSAPDQPPFPEIVAVPPEMVTRRDWEYEIVDDLQTRGDQRSLLATERGYRSALRVPIRLDSDTVVAGVSFFSFTPSLYRPADAAIALRIADKIAVSFARERREAAAKRADEADARAARLEARVRQLTEELDARTGYRRVVGQSPQWRQVLTQATQVAPTETTVLLLGESGTGKEVAARFVHRASPRANGPFVALNCAALPEQLLEAELFGYERGAFTGAVQSKPGQLEQAAGGTLFLDEVAEMSPSAQAKFLRVLQEREFQRLGGTRVLRTDARIVAATNRDLLAAIDKGLFREDLYYRLHVFAILLPPLRDRREDVLSLTEAFLSEFGRSLGRPPSGIARDARQALLDYHWPGNVRELRNVLERAAILCDGGLITMEHLALRPRPGTAAPMAAPPAAPAATPIAPEPSPPPMSAASDLHSAERAMIEKALKDARYNKSVAAKALGLSRTQLYVRLRRHGLE